MKYIIGALIIATLLIHIPAYAEPIRDSTSSYMTTGETAALLAIDFSSYIDNGKYVTFETPIYEGQSAMASSHLRDSVELKRLQKSVSELSAGEQRACGTYVEPRKLF